MMIEHLEAANRASVFLREPLLDALLHKEVAEIARKNDNLVAHLSYLLAYVTPGLATVLLIELVQIKQVEPLKLQDVVSVLEHREFGIGIEPSTDLHEEGSLDAHRLIGDHDEKEDAGHHSTRHY